MCVLSLVLWLLVCDCGVVVVGVRCCYWWRWCCCCFFFCDIVVVVVVIRVGVDAAVGVSVSAVVVVV